MPEAKSDQGFDSTVDVRTAITRAAAAIGSRAILSSRHSGDPELIRRAISEAVAILSEQEAERNTDSLSIRAARLELDAIACDRHALLVLGERVLPVVRTNRRLANQLETEVWETAVAAAYASFLNSPQQWKPATVSGWRVNTVLLRRLLHQRAESRRSSEWKRLYTNGRALARDTVLLEHHEHAVHEADPLDRERLAEIFKAARADLTLRQRMGIFGLYASSSMESKEIAVLLGVTDGALRVCMTRARRRLSEDLAPPSQQVA